MSDLKKGRDILADQVTSQPGVSDVGIAIRRGDERNKGVVSHGYARVSDPKSHKEHAKRYLHAMVNALKAQPKPKLTRSEVENFDNELKKNKYLSDRIKELRQQREVKRQKDLHEHFAAKGLPVPEHLKAPLQEQTINHADIIKQFRSKNKVTQPVSTPSTAPAPSRYGKLHDPDRSGTVDYTKKPKIVKAQVSVQPDQISEPMIQNRTTISEPMKVSGPNIMSPTRDEGLKKYHNTLRRLIGGLKKVDPKTHLPGIMLDKKVK